MPTSRRLHTGVWHRGDVQLHPVTDRPLHADFMRVSGSTKITVAVPVHFINQDKAPGLKRGGLLNIVRHDIDLVVRADNIPEFIEVDVSNLGIHDTVHVSAIAVPAGVELQFDTDEPVVTVLPPTVEEVKVEAAAAEAATPEAGAPAEPAKAEGKAAAPAKGTA